MNTDEHQMILSTPPADALLVTNDDGTTLVRLEADGTVSGDLAERHPEAIPALQELGARVQVIVTRATGVNPK